MASTACRRPSPLLKSVRHSKGLQGGFECSLGRRGAAACKCWARVHRSWCLQTVQEKTGVDLKPIENQVVVVMGASSGIGRETALRFAERGAKVVIAARSGVGLRSLVDDLRRLGGEGHGSRRLRVRASRGRRPDCR